MAACMIEETWRLKCNCTHTRSPVDIKFTTEQASTLTIGASAYVLSEVTSFPIPVDENLRAILRGVSLALGLAGPKGQAIVHHPSPRCIPEPIGLEVVRFFAIALRNYCC
ncbi:uncharacterized protein TrAFT101_005654 [Trichoderma asperellum]|uniref:uncharacterized protein n=1 Tax=Trichoderma asperellum TaxID=101201 RepID=UPI003316C8B0|nr:hypothetical protein TrAFT101_005654 [Trichoderma asperellum]